MRRALAIEANAVELPSGLWPRVLRQARRRRSASRVALAGLAASILLIALVPGPRAVATNVIRSIFQIGSVEFIVHSGSDPAPPTAYPQSKGLDPAPDTDYRYFYTAAGALPADGLAALDSLGMGFRLPTWLPDEVPKRLQLLPEGYSGEPTFYYLALENYIGVRAMFPGWGTLEFDGRFKLDAKPVVLGAAEGLEVKVGNQISYYLSLDNVSYTVSGPMAEAEAVRKIAESLAPKND